MMKECTYKVAGHRFKMILPESEKLWSALQGQYSPFEDNEDGEVLFSIEMCKELPQGERICFYDEPTEDGETKIKMFRQDTDWIVEMAVDRNRPLCATTWINEDFSKAQIKLESRYLSDAVFAINNATMLLFAFASAPLGTLEMHASVIGYNNHGYLFLGKSGTGKSTHSSLWLKHIEGTELMNDDNPVVRVMEDGRVFVFGSPWSGKTPCYKNVSAPVGAFVQIRQCPENKISRMSVLAAYTSLFSSISGIKNDKVQMSDHLHDTMDKVLRTVPFYLLDCRPDEEAARLCNGSIAL